MCERIITIKPKLFLINFYNNFRDLAKDPIVNVRISLASTLFKCY